MLFYEAAVYKKPENLLRAIGEKGHIPRTSANAVIYDNIIIHFSSNILHK